MKKEKYYVGLDMGTNSVGWAVTDPQYRILRAKGKDMWGIREFDEAKPASERRGQRVSRRRLEREKARIGLLKVFFDDEIKKVDPDFYTRLENSKYYAEDKDDRLNSVNGIFDDEDYKDADYYKDYPTIFHLRKELIWNEKADSHDVRLVFLALLNMFKHRGHFLDPSANIDGETRSVDDMYGELCHLLTDRYEISLPENVKGQDIIDIIKDRDYSRSVRAERIQELLEIGKAHKELVRMICGLKVSAKKIYSDIEVDEDITFSFSDSDMDEKREKLVDCYGEDKICIVDTAHELYNKGMLDSILNGAEYLSDARVASYKEHKNDLRLLKDIYKKYGDETEYSDMFRNATKGSYSAYVNSSNSRIVRKDTSGRGKGTVIRRGMEERSKEDFYKRITGFLKSKGLKEDSDDEGVRTVYNRISSDSFMPKQLTSANGVIPNHVHAKEMKKILTNAERYLPFLKEKDEGGRSVSERIIQLFMFHIPYYVGPTSEKSEKMGGNGWVVRKEAGQVLPWNLESKVDLPKTRERFIERLIRNCTYLNDEKVLPKGSLLYEKFCVLNEINNIRVDGERLDPKYKQDMFYELYQTQGRVTRRKVISWLKCRGLIEGEDQISGIDININNQLSSFAKFYGVFGDDMKKDSYVNMVEDIIKLGTIYGNAKSVLKKCIEDKYSDKLDDKQLKKILGFKFKDWSRLSKAFLELEAEDRSTGENISLIEAMWRSNHNLTELLYSEEYSFKEELESRQNKALKSLSEFKAADLEDMYFSAPVRRMIWQTIQILQEIEKIKGYPPARVFVEMTRQPDDKKERKNSRGKQLIELYKAIKDENKEWAKEHISAIQKADSEGELRSKKLFLYYTQMGRDMYTGKEISLDELMNNNRYDIDHIYPRQFVKDDNIANNMVLVNKESNINKTNRYPLDEKIRNNPKVRELWDALRKNGLINEEKYKRLSRNTGFTEEEQIGFIQRQLVETGQGTKGVAGLLKNLYDPEQTTIVYVKARNVSEFRRYYKGQDDSICGKYEFPKSRIVNDFHHAHDAYLNIVVGNAYYVKFTQDPKNFILKEYAVDSKANSYNLNKMFGWDIKRGDDLAWRAMSKDGSDPGTIETVRRMLDKNSPLLTRLSYEGHGKIADATLYSSCRVKDEGYIPLKTKDERMLDMKKYGGYTSITTAYFFLVEHDKGKKRIRTIETVPFYMADRIERDPEQLEKYCIEKLRLVNPSVRMRKIKLHSLIRRNGYYAHITGVTGNQIYMRNAVELCLERNYVKYARKIEKYNDDEVTDKVLSSDANIELYDELIKKHRDTIFARKPNSVVATLSDNRDKFISLSIEEQAKVIYQILKLSAIGLPKADLKLIGGSPNAGITLMGKNISDKKEEEIMLTSQSVNGLSTGTPVYLVTI